MDVYANRKLDWCPNCKTTNYLIPKIVIGEPTTISILCNECLHEGPKELNAVNASLSWNKKVAL